jgi:DUF971 family protein
MSKPKKILVDVDNSLIQINWPDGHESVYDLTYLRRACPCAECQPWKEGIGKPGETPEAVLKAAGKLNAVSDVSAVGGYAIQFNWADGHSYGIYDWDYMRGLCPCDECTAKRRQAG